MQGIKNSRSILEYSVLFIIIWASSSYFVLGLDAIVRIMMCLGSAALLFITGKKVFGKELLIYSLVLITIVLVSSLFTGDQLFRLIYAVLAVIVAMLFVSSMSIDRFSKVFTNLMCFLSVFSLITFLIMNIAPQIIRMFPVLSFSHNYPCHNFIFSYVQYYTPVRNAGIFWEPGAYQTYLCFAVLFELFLTKKPRNIVVLVFIVTLVTTKSSVGLICVILLLILWNIKDYDGHFNKQFKVTFVLLGGIVFIFLLYNFLPSDWRFTIFGKIENMFKDTSGGTVTSSSVRMDSIIYPMKSFFSSPLIGVGFDGLAKWSETVGHSMNTCTPVNWFAIYGVFYGAIMFKGIFNLVRKMHKFLLPGILIFSVIILSMISEQYVNNPSILIFILYGLYISKNQDKRKEKYILKSE